MDELKLDMDATGIIGAIHEIVKLENQIFKEALRQHGDAEIANRVVQNILRAMFTPASKGQ